MWPISFIKKIVGIGTIEATKVWFLKSPYWRIIWKHTKTGINVGLKPPFFALFGRNRTPVALCPRQTPDNRFFSILVDNLLLATHDRCVSELPNMCRPGPRAFCQNKMQCNESSDDSNTYWHWALALRSLLLKIFSILWWPPMQWLIWWMPILKKGWDLCHQPNLALCTVALFLR